MGYSRGLQRADSTLFREERRPSTRTRWASQSPLDPVSPTPTLACPPQPCTLLSFSFPSIPFLRPCSLSLAGLRSQQSPPSISTSFVDRLCLPGGKPDRAACRTRLDYFSSLIHVLTSSAIWHKRRPRRHPRSMTLFCLVTDGAGGSEKMMLALWLDSLLVPSRSTRSGQGHVASAGLTMHSPPTTAVRP